MQFYLAGGLDAILSTCRKYTDAIARISGLKPSDCSENDQQELVHVYGGLKVALNLLFSPISFKPTMDAGLVTAYISKDQPEAHPHFFEPRDFLVKMRLTIGPFIRDIWRSSWLISAPPPVSKYVVQFVKEITGGKNEVSRGDLGDAADVLPSSGQGLLRPEATPAED